MVALRGLQFARRSTAAAVLLLLLCAAGVLMRHQPSRITHDDALGAGRRPVEIERDVRAADRADQAASGNVRATSPGDGDPLGANIVLDGAGGAIESISG